MVTLGNQKFLFHGRHLIHFRGSFSQMAACMKVPNDSSGIVLYLPTPSALRFSLLPSFPSRSIRVADGWLWTGQQWRLLFSEEPGKVSQEPKRGAEEHLHRRWRSAGVRRHWLKEEGAGAGDQPQLPRCLDLGGGAAPSRPGLPLP